jgi:hypothetical protein
MPSGARSSSGVRAPQDRDLIDIERMPSERGLRLKSTQGLSICP